MPMAQLRQICLATGFADPQTYIQSGNLVFRTPRKDLEKMAQELESAIEAECGFRPPVILRSAAELAAVVEKNPLAGRPDLNPAKLQITFYPKDPGDAGRAKLMALDHAGEEVQAHGRETYIYFHNGVGQSKMKFAALDKAMGSAGTGRNLNTVLKLLEMSK